MTNEGQIECFNDGVCDIHSYLLHLKYYIKTNKITDENKFSVLLTVVGPKIVSLLQDLIAPKEVDTPYKRQLSRF